MAAGIQKASKMFCSRLFCGILLGLENKTGVSDFRCITAQTHTQTDANTHTILTSGVKVDKNNSGKTTTGAQILSILNMRLYISGKRSLQAEGGPFSASAIVPLKPHSHSPTMAEKKEHFSEINISDPAHPRAALQGHC